MLLTELSGVHSVSGLTICRGADNTTDIIIRLDGVVYLISEENLKIPEKTLEILDCGEDYLYPVQIQVVDCICTATELNNCISIYNIGRQRILKFGVVSDINDKVHTIFELFGETFHQKSYSPRYNNIIVHGRFKDIKLSLYKYRKLNMSSLYGTMIRVDD